jgi:hypothetical protein
MTLLLAESLPTDYSQQANASTPWPMIDSTLQQIYSEMHM